MKVYLAAQYARRSEIKGYVSQLEAAGLTVTSTWTSEHYTPTITLKDIQDKNKKELARRDRHELESADAILFFSEDPDKQPARGGRHVEFGMAVAWGLKLVVVGGKENIFHYLPCVKVFPFFSEAMAYLVKESQK
jgi:nucleoside 2-deoxyribosyltransferase